MPLPLKGTKVLGEMAILGREQGKYKMSLEYIVCHFKHLLTEIEVVPTMIQESRSFCSDWHRTRTAWQNGESWLDQGQKEKLKYN